ncbi:MAG: ABC transporter substrate-binding protein [Epsilonproteobacteria bacterium]|nr:ABC transporter substrate-binding protein [Campylobacterota bacterium]
MRILWLLLSFTFYIHATNILVMNSNGKIDRYQTMENTFSKAIAQKVQHVDIAFMKEDDIKEYLYDIYPDIVYAIGTKAYQYAKKYVPEKKIYFSSIVNYKRFSMGKNRFGVSNELHPGMQLTLIKALLPKIKSIGIVYSRYTQSIYDGFKTEAKKLGITVIGQKITKTDHYNFEKFKNIDAFLMLADPVMLADEKKVKVHFSHFKKLHIPVIAYHPLYLKYGAVLIIAVDVETIGRQVASMIESDMHGHSYQTMQMPIGTKVIFNQGLAKRMGLHYDKSALGIVNKVIK